MTLRNILLRAIGSIGAISLGFSTSFFTIQSPSLAESRTICNNTGKSLQIAIGYKDGYSEGWYTVGKGLCLNLLNFNGKHGVPAYYRAEADGFLDNDVWNGNKSRSLCVNYGQTPSTTYTEAFELGVIQLKNSSDFCLMIGENNSARIKYFGSIGSGQNLRK